MAGAPHRPIASQLLTSAAPFSWRSLTTITSRHLQDADRQSDSKLLQSRRDPMATILPLRDISGGVLAAYLGTFFPFPHAETTWGRVSPYVGNSLPRRDDGLPYHHIALYKY
ncbi:hypothetical protein DFH07DRAFT_935107, partial [Mycena maculata]